MATKRAIGETEVLVCEPSLTTATQTIKVANNVVFLYEVIETNYKLLNLSYEGEDFCRDESISLTKGSLQHKIISQTIIK